MPALFTKIVGVPKARFASANIASTAASEQTSASSRTTSPAASRMTAAVSSAPSRLVS